MAKNILPTNYQDDIMNESAGGKRKYRMIHNEDGTVSFDDLTVYDLEGSDYGAGDINRTNEAVNQSFDKNKLIRDMDAINALTQEGYAPDALALKDVNDSLGGMYFYEDEDGNKYVVGADSVPKKLGKEPIRIPIYNYAGSYGTDITNVVCCDGYETCTIDSISVKNGTFYVALYSTESGTSQISKTAYSGTNKTIPLNGAKSVGFIFAWNPAEYTSSMTVSNIVIS